MDLSKFAEHARSTHFAIVLVSVTLLAFAQTKQDSEPYQALQEFLVLQKLSSDWQPGDLKDIGAAAFEEKHGVPPTARVYGTVTLFPNSTAEATQGVFSSDPIDDLGFPYTEPFAASATTLLSEDVFSEWQTLSESTLITGQYSPPLETFTEGIEDGPYTHTPHREVRLKQPESLREFSDFWNVLSLEHTFRSMLPAQASDGLFSMTQLTQFAAGKAVVRFSEQGCETSEFETQTTSGGCLWMFAGGLQNRISRIENEGNIVAAEDAIAFGDYGAYYYDVSSRSETILHLSLWKNFIAMVTYGIGWQEAWNFNGGNKDNSVHTSVTVPVDTEMVRFDAQRFVLARLPVGMLEVPQTTPGSFEQSFPNLGIYLEQYGSMPFLEMENLLRDQLEQSSQTATITIFGVSIPIGLLSLFGGALVLCVQVYHYLHAYQLTNRLAAADEENPAWEVPWIGLYLDRKLPKATVFLTIVLLPSVAVLYSVVPLALSRNWVALVSLPVLLMSLQTFHLYSRFWKRFHT